MTQFELLCKHISAQSVKGLHFLFTYNKKRPVIVFVSRFLGYVLSFFLGSVTFPITLCFALLCHLSLLRLLLCVSCQVLDIIYDLVLCPDCETPDKTSISATNTNSVGSLLHSTPLNHSVCVNTRYRLVYISLWWCFQSLKVQSMAPEYSCIEPSSPQL